VPETVLLALRVVKAPELAAVFPIEGGDARYVEKPVPDTVLLADNVVNAPVDGLEPPIGVASMVPPSMLMDAIAPLLFTLRA
jgi:hypothetical protein